MTQVNGQPVGMNFGEQTPETLAEIHNEMLLTAVDFGLAGQPVEAFASVAEGVAACERLHASIERARERAAAPPKKERKRAAAKSKSAVAKIAADAGAVVAGYTEPAKETKVKKAKKSGTKKTAKKAVAKKAGNGASRSRLSDDVTITWLADGNPAREGTIFWDRVEKIRKSKNIAAVKKVAGIPADATECAKRGWCKLGRGAAA